MTEQETIYTIALTQLNRLSLMNAHVLYESMGSATNIFTNIGRIRDFIPDASDLLVNTLKNTDEALKRAESEFEYTAKKNIRCICYNDSDYPALLRQCPDAPLVIYFFGNGSLNRKRIIDIVGTRKCTDYGRDIIRNLVSDLSKSVPDILIVSGLAYGVDVHSHIEALNNGIDTVGVLAHGLDTIYPSRHRNIAAKMSQHGGLLTEYISGSELHRANFVRRNRIVAGMSHATVVVESATKGGAMITAGLAGDYDREVFAFPGRVYDQYSQGCNKLICNNQAHLAQSASDILRILGWEEETPQTKPEPTFFPELTPEESAIVDCLSKSDTMQINKISIETNIPFHQVSALLFELELKGLVAVLGGARYRLLKNS